MDGRWQIYDENDVLVAMTYFESPLSAEIEAKNMMKRDKRLGKLKIKDGDGNETGIVTRW